MPTDADQRRKAWSTPMNRVRRFRSWRLPAAAALLALAAVGAAPAAPAYALERRSDEAVVVAAGEVVPDDLFASGRVVQIDGTVQGDVFAFAQLVTVAGTIEGDLIAAAQQVVVDGRVQGDVRAAGASVQINGAVDKNVTGAAHLLQLSTSGRIGGNWIGAGDTISLGGDVGGTLAAAASDLLLQGRIGRTAEVAADSLNAGPNARIGGDLRYHGDRPAVPPQLVAGEIVRVHDDVRGQMRERARRQMREHGAPWRTAAAVVWNVLSLAWLAGSAIAGLVVLRLFPRFVAQFLEVLEARPLPSLGIGALALIFTLPVAFAAALTIVGLPIAALLAAGYFAGIFVGWLLLAVAVGSILVGFVRRGAPRRLAWSFLLGLLVLYVGTRMPFAGGLVAFAAAALGLGALLLALHRAWAAASGQPAQPAGSPL
jgi:cytoskeletal protein CcmA (bactofilin family)